jgi:hypothetical protein
LLRWRRDWLVQRIGEARGFAADATEAVDQMTKVLCQAADHVRGQRAAPVSPDLLDRADAAWLKMLGRRYVYAGQPLQLALVELDRRRDAAVRAINGQDGRVDVELVGPRLDEFFAARVEVFTAVVAMTDDINTELARNLLPRPLVLMRRLRRRPVHGQASPTWLDDDLASRRRE